MPSTKKGHKGPKLIPGAFLASVMLIACSQGTPGTLPDGPPTDAPRALVYGMANSPIFEALKSKVKLTMSSSSQKATDFDMVILDGDGFTGQQLSEDAFVREAIQSGVWVLSLDVAEEDKVGLGDMLHASSQGAARAYLTRQGLSAERQPTSRLIEIRNPDQEPNYVAKEIVGYLKAGVAAQQTVPDDTIPSRALTYFVHHTSDHSAQFPQVNNPFFNGTLVVEGDDGSTYPRAGPQHLSWTVDHEVRVFLDASLDPKGSFQHILVNVQGSSDPSTPTIDNIDNCSSEISVANPNDPNPDDPGTVYSGNCEIAWFQTQLNTSTSLPTTGGLQLKKATPANENNSKTVTSGGYSFSVGYSADSGPSATFQYTSPTTTTTITDWQLLNSYTSDNQSSQAKWVYASATIYDGTNTKVFDPNPWDYYVGGVAPKHPNDLSLENFQYATESYWVSNEVINDTIVIRGVDEGVWTDAYVVQTDYDNNKNGNSPHCIVSCYLTQHMARSVDSNPWALTVDMSAVVPVPTKSLTFNPNPAVAGQTVTGTLILAEPTPIPAEVLMSSDKPGISPENDTYTIPANEDTLTFKVVTGAEGCQPESATIRAFYADGQNQSLTVNPPSNCPQNVGR
jgi:hypothetical protein